MCHVTASNKNIQFSKTRGEVKMCVCVYVRVNQNVLNFLIEKYILLLIHYTFILLLTFIYIQS